MQRPGETGLPAGVGPTAAALDDIGVAEMLDGVERHADAGADEGRNGPPGAKIDIGVDERDPFRLAGGVVVGVVRNSASVVEAIERVEAGLAAIFAGHVGTKPAVPLIADAGAIERRAVEATLVKEGELRRRRERRMRDAVHELIALADIAAQIPAAGGDRLIRRC